MVHNEFLICQTGGSKYRLVLSKRFKTVCCSKRFFFFFPPLNHTTKRTPCAFAAPARQRGGLRFIVSVLRPVLYFSSIEKYYIIYRSRVKNSDGLTSCSFDGQHVARTIMFSGKFDCTLRILSTKEYRPIVVFTFPGIRGGVSADAVCSTFYGRAV